MVAGKMDSIEEQLETLKVAFDSSYDGLHILDKDGYTLMINKACERIEGISAASIGDKNVRQLVEEGYFSESVTLKVLEKKEPVTIIQKVKNGNEVLVTGMPVFKGDVIDKVIVNSRDITELNTLKSEISEKKLEIDKYKEECQRLHKIITRTGDIVFKSVVMEKIINMALLVATVDSTVLITGESGTGKGLIGNFIHNNGPRKNNSFIKIDCGSIPEPLFESELFGYERGAFTGASSKGKIGLVQLADGGTLFLDEIGEVPLPMQVKLLRLIQDREIIRIGGKEPIPVNIRIIAATNKDLSKMLSAGKFREDLFYRINVIPIHIPPLCERKEDIASLVLNWIGKLNQKYGTDKRLSIEAMDKLIAYDWPGNIRELENTIERIMILSTGSIIDVCDLPELIGQGKRHMPISNASSLKGMSHLHEKEILEQLLLEKMTPAEMADALHVNVTTVRRKLHKYNLTTNKR